MPPATDTPATPVPGAIPAWAGGAVFALGASSLVLLLHGNPVGSALWSYLPHPPVQSVSKTTAFAAALGIGLAAVWAAAVITPPRRIAGLLAGAVFVTLFQSIVLALYNMAWEPLPALLSLVGAGTLTAFLRPDPTGPGTWFRGRVSPPVLDHLHATQDHSFLRPDQRAATVITCRLLNESALREALPAREFLKLYEAFRTKAATVLLNGGACLDPTESSGVRAFFGLPLPGTSPADEAVTAALALDDAMREFAGAAAQPTHAPTCGIGLATGKLTAGLIGETYTVLGEAVELSRWLAAETANYEVRLLTDAATHFAAESIEDRPLEFVNPPDGAAVEIFQLLGTTGSLSQEALSRRGAFRDAIMLLRAGHTEDALGRFADAREGLTVTDPVLDYFVSLATDQSQRDAASSAGSNSAGPPAPASLSSTDALTPPSPSSASLAVPRRQGKPSRKLPRRP